MDSNDGDVEHGCCSFITSQVTRNAHTVGNGDDRIGKIMTLIEQYCSLSKVMSGLKESQ